MVVSGISNNLKVLMAQRKTDRETLVREMGISSATITKVHQNKNVTLLTLVRFCRHFNVPIEDFITVELGNE